MQSKEYSGFQSMSYDYAIVFIVQATPIFHHSSILHVHVPCTWPSLNWSPPNAETHGFMPPVPNAITIKPMAARVLEEGREGGRVHILNLQN